MEVDVYQLGRQSPEQKGWGLSDYMKGWKEWNGYKRGEEVSYNRRNIVIAEKGK